MLAIYQHHNVVLLSLRTGGTRTELQRRIMEIIKGEDLEALEAALTDPEVDVDYEESNKDNFLTFIASVNRNRPNISSLEPPKKKKQTGVVFANNQSSDMCKIEEEITKHLALSS